MDEPNEQAASVIRYLKNEGIHTVMITGDSASAGEAIGKRLNVDQVAANVLPENKAKAVRALKKPTDKPPWWGDGINDAPALVQATSVFAMGKGQMLLSKWGTP